MIKRNKYDEALIISLADTVLKNGFRYELYQRGTKAFIYTQISPDEEIIIGYEVFKRIIDPPKKIFEMSYPPRERFPKDNDFGSYAWAYTKLEHALEKYEALENVIISNE